MRFMALCRLALVAVLLASLPVRADVFASPVPDDAGRQAALQQLTARVQQQSRVEGRFEQRKTLALLQQPIRSEGRFQLQPEVFLWHILEPFDIAYRFADNRLERTMDGETDTIEPAAEPTLYGFFSFFHSLFSLSEAALEKYFEVFFEPTDSDAWTLGLKPRQAAIARSLQSLVIHGEGVHIGRVLLTEQGGDTTELLFFYPASEAGTVAAQP